jgi:hypothetical protein
MSGDLNLTREFRDDAELCFLNMLRDRAESELALFRSVARSSRCERNRSYFIGWFEEMLIFCDTSNKGPDAFMDRFPAPGTSK